MAIYKETKRHQNSNEYESNIEIEKQPLMAKREL